MKFLTTKFSKGNIICKPEIDLEDCGYGFLRLLVSPAGPSLPRLQPANIILLHTHISVNSVAVLPVTCFTLKQQPGC